MVRGKFFFLFLLIFSLTALQAQEISEEITEETTEEEVTEVEPPLSPQNQRIEMEIKTSTLAELAAWCRSLGLSEGGTRDDMSRRLREHFNIREPRQRASSRKIITIDSAQTSEYFSIDTIGEDYARLKGDVSLSLIDGDTTHKIRADEILFNRTRNIITARGKVVYEKIESDKTETFRGENITVNIENWASIFLEGNTERRLDNDGTAYLFSGTVISRTDQDTTILQNAKISSAGNEEALWSINASRLWLLPGSDFAIFNAILKVGEIPVLYIPFFYFPSDDPIFHPVLGYRSREGGFIQTTTYLIGQPKADSSETSSLSRILGNSNDREKRPEGLFLRSTGRKKTDQNALSLKLLADYYVNLGGYIGLDMAVPRINLLNPLNLSLGVAFSRTVSHTGGIFSPFIPNADGIYDGSSDWNHSYFFNEPVPFRYRMTFQSSISGKYGGVSWNLPFYSDPYINSDFTQNRSEKMDFMNMIQQGAAMGSDDSTQNELSGFLWNINGNLNPSLQFLSPVVSRITISKIATELTFRSIRDDVVSANNPYSPARRFFAPDKYTIYDVSGAISGTPLTIGGAQKSGTQNTNQEINNPLEGIGIPISPFPDSEEADTRQRSPLPPDMLVPPAISQTFSLPGSGNIRFNLDYSITPSSSAELQFMTSTWKTYDDVDWEDTQSILTSVGGSSNINLRMDHTSGLFNNTVTFSGSGTWRDFSFLNEEAYLKTDGTVDEARINEARRQQYAQTNYSTFYSYNGTVRPLFQNNIFSQSNIQYNFRGTLVRSRRYNAERSPDGPDLTAQWGSWVKEERKDGEDIYGLTSHRLSTNVAANVMDRTQNISISTDLPPLDELIITNATFRFWISETNINFRIERPVTDNENNEWKFKPIYLTETLRFDKIGSFSFYMVIDPEKDNEINNISTSLTLWNFRIAFTALKEAESVFVMPGGWQSRGEPVFLPKNLSLTYNYPSTARDFFDKKFSLSFNVNTALSFDLQRHTNSSFTLSLGVSLTIPRFLEVTFSASTQNSVIWRYFKEVPGMEDLTYMYPEGPQNNVFIDLFDSFNFADESLRRRSGFKIQRFNLKAVHFLGDWNAELSVSMYPWLDEKAPMNGYKIIADIEFLIQWKPITEIKNNIRFEGKTEKWSVIQ